MQPLHTESAIDATANVSVNHARELIESSEKLRSRREKANRKRFGRLFKDPKAIEVTITLTDEVMRIHSMRWIHRRSQISIQSIHTCMARAPIP